MECNNCGNKYAYNLRIRQEEIEKGVFVKRESCDRCGGIRLESLADVSDVHEPYFDEHLCDKAHPNGQMIHSRRQKAAVLNQLGLREKRESSIPYIADVKKRQTYFRDNWG